MKLVLTLAALCFGASNALTCSTSGTRGSPPQECPDGMECKITNQGRPEVDVPNSGICVSTGSPTNSVDYNEAYAAFDAADADHSGTITFGGAYQALSKLFPDASEETLDRLTKEADKGHYDGTAHKYVFRDGKIDKSEFATMYLSLLRQQQQPNDNSDICKTANPCGYGQACYVCRNTQGYCCKAIVTVGPKDEPNGGLTDSEMDRVTNLFQAINTQKTSTSGDVSDEYLTYGELFAFLRKAATTLGSSTDLYRKVATLVVGSDQDHNSRVDFEEFVAACANLKKSDPTDFPEFLSVAESQNALPVGSPCVPTSSNQCAEGSDCLPASRPQVMDGDMIMDGPSHPDGHLIAPPMDGGRRLQEEVARYGPTSSYSCQVRPDTCETCVQSNGKWFGSRCIVSGEPQIMDGHMTSTVTGCRKDTAMDNANCAQYKSCAPCTSNTNDNTYGQLCAWVSYGSDGNCIQNQGGMWGRPMITAASMCDTGVVHVDG